MLLRRAFRSAAVVFSFRDRRQFLSLDSLLLYECVNLMPVAGHAPLQAFIVLLVERVPRVTQGMANCCTVETAGVCLPCRSSTNAPRGRSSLLFGSFQAEFQHSGLSNVITAPARIIRLKHRKPHFREQGFTNLQHPWSFSRMR